MIGDQWLLLFVAIALAMAVQLAFTSKQAMAFTRELNALRKQGTVAAGMGGGTWFGPKVFVALVTDGDGLVKDAIRFRGLTQFARPKPAPHYLGLSVRRLAEDLEVPGCSSRERSAARQAAQTLSAAGGTPTASGALRGEESPST